MIFRSTARKQHFFKPPQRSFLAMVGTVTLVFSWAGMASMSGQSPYASTSDFEQYARTLRESALQKKEPQVFVPSSAAPATTAASYQSRGIFSSRYPWKENIVTTVFNIGELPTKNNPTPNHSSSWDPNWEENYGGFDDPETTHRRGFLPPGFTPRQNPFYCALPYNDVTRGSTKAEAKVVIPGSGRRSSRKGTPSAKDAGSPSGTATAWLTRNGRTAGRSARTITSTFSAPNYPART